MITTPKWFGEFKKGYIHLDNNIEVTVARESQDQTHEQYKYLYSCVYSSLAFGV